MAGRFQQGFPVGRPFSPPRLIGIICVTGDEAIRNIAVMEPLDRQGILDFLRQHRQELAERFGVRQVGIFGSFATNQQTTASDIDLLVEMEEPDFDKLSELHDFLEDSFQHRVDITRVSRKIQTPFRTRIGKQAIYA